MTQRKAYRSDLTDAQWKRIKPLLPKPKWTGRKPVDDREVINGILYVLATGCPWEYLPHDISASYQTCQRRLLEYQKRRVWQKIVADLLKEAHRKGFINLKNAYHDASMIKSKKGAKKKSVFQENT
ncbi:MAG: transposase [Acidobacteria bacterium]|nr:transposase [Acidobacteriota bacterium]